MKTVKSTTAVKSDEHGLYVRTNGTIYRPVPSKWSSVHPNAIDPDNPYNEHWRQTGFLEGMKVKARHVSQSNFCRVETNSRVELWHGHGSYYGEFDPVKKSAPILQSNDVWAPKEEKAQ